MSDSGFRDEPPPAAAGRRRSRSAPASRPIDATAAPGHEPAPRRRPSGLAVFLTLVVLGAAIFGAWAWTSRAHADDVAAYQALAQEVSVLDRDVLPLTHGEAPPCRDGLDGVITRTYPSTAPQAAEMLGYLDAKGWSRTTTPPATAPSTTAPSTPAAPVVATLTKTVAGGRALTLSVLAPSEFARVEAVRSSSPGSSIGCLLR